MYFQFTFYSCLVRGFFFCMNEEYTLYSLVILIPYFNLLALLACAS